jgi:hypothetical protein
MHSNNPRDYSGAKNLARAYYAAGNFFDVMTIFDKGDIEEANLEKDLNTSRRKYCKWRATEILKAVKANEELPAPVDDDGEISEEKTQEESKAADSKEDADDFGIPEAPVGRGGDAKGDDDDMDIPEAPVYRPPAPAPAPAPPVYQPPAPAPAPASSGGWFGSKKKGGSASNEAIADATELCTFAMAALKTKDVDLARQRLQQALESLG